MEPTPPEKPAVPLLQYADALSRYGVVVAVENDSVSIRVPKAGWRRTGPYVPMMLGSFCTCVGAFTWLARGAGPLSLYVGAMGGAGLLMFALAAILLLGAATGSGYETRFDMNRAALTLTELGTPSDEMPEGRREFTWPTSQIGTIKGDLFGMGLTIQIVGTDLHECLHGHPEPIRRGVAKILNDAVERFTAMNKPRDFEV